MHLIVSDIHGSEEGMLLVRQAIEHFHPEGIISAGDQCPDPLYSAFYSSLIAVRGNCDRFYEYYDIPFPPLSREIKLYGKRIVITQGMRPLLMISTCRRGIFSYQGIRMCHLSMKRMALYSVTQDLHQDPALHQGQLQQHCQTKAFFSSHFWISALSRQYASPSDNTP